MQDRPKVKRETEKNNNSPGTAETGSFLGGGGYFFGGGGLSDKSDRSDKGAKKGVKKHTDLAPVCNAL